MRQMSFAITVALGAIIAACSSTKTSGFDDPTQNGNPAGSTGGFGGDGTSGGSGHACAPNPKNYDIPGNNCDDDDDGTVDNPPTCDDDAVGSPSAVTMAKALGICAEANKDGYGLVDAAFTQGYNRDEAPQAAQHGILGKFGNVIKPREGKALAVLSSGYGKEYDGNGQEPFGGIGGSTGDFMPNGMDWSGGFGGNGAAPPGFPKAASGCLQDSQVNDVVDLKLTLVAPQNASGVKFDFNFYSGEWPAYICTNFNDGFIAYLSAKGFNNGKADNISFDKNKNPVSVNNGFFDRCTSNSQVGCAGTVQKTMACAGGTSELAGTGFGIQGKWCGSEGFPAPSNETTTDGGATGWLTSQAPVTPGEQFTIEFMIWDAGDGYLDSSILLDNFTWVEGDVVVGTDRPR